MALEEERNLSNKSNSTDDLPKEVVISCAVLNFLFSLLMVIYLSIRLKKRAWDSPAKRFANFFNMCLALVALWDAVGLSGVLYYIVFSGLSIVNYLYFSAMYVALSLQTVNPFLPERLKLYARKTHCVKFTEIASHVLFLLLAISTSVFNCYNSDFLAIYAGILYSIILLAVILSYFCLILAFVYLRKFFKYHNNKKKGVKYMIIKLLFFLIIFMISIIIIYVSFVVLVIHLNQTSYFLSLLLVILQCVFYFILSISVVSLNHPLDIWCCKCCCRRSPGHTPLLPVNDTEGQQTNPISVWDHRNVPSYTVTNLPYDMSDCRSDYEQLV